MSEYKCYHCHNILNDYNEFTLHCAECKVYFNRSYYSELNKPLNESIYKRLEQDYKDNMTDEEMIKLKEFTEGYKKGLIEGNINGLEHGLAQVNNVKEALQELIGKVKKMSGINQ